MADADIPVVDIEISERMFVVADAMESQREVNRLPEWLQNPMLRMDDSEMRRECSARHLFVNALSKFCHICGEPR